MTQAIYPHVNQPAIIKFGNPLFDATHLLGAGYAEGSGTLDTPIQLGVSVDGVDITETTFDDPIIADTGGMNCPVDLQDMGKVAIIRYQLVVYDSGALQALRLRSSNPVTAYNAGQPINEGILPLLGAIAGLNLFSCRLIITGTDTDANGFVDSPIRFYNTYLRGAQSVKLGTRRKIWNMEHFAWALIGNAGSASGKVLYDHVAL